MSQVGRAPGAPVPKFIRDLEKPEIGLEMSGCPAIAGYAVSSFHNVGTCPFGDQVRENIIAKEGRYFFPAIA